MIKAICRTARDKALEQLYLPLLNRVAGTMQSSAEGWEKKVPHNVHAFNFLNFRIFLAHNQKSQKYI